MADKNLKSHMPVAPKAKAASPAAAKPVASAAATPKAIAKPAPVEASVVPAPIKAPVAAVAKAAAPIIEAAQAAVTTATAKVAETVQKEETIMATNFDAPKFEAPKMFNEMNDRAKNAMEKGSKMFEDANEFAKGNVEALVESGKIAAKGLETLGQDAADYSRKSFEGLTATMKSLASIKSPTDFFKLQSEYVRSSFDAAVAQGSKSTETMIKLAGDAAQPISNRFAVAAEKVKVAA